MAKVWPNTYTARHSPGFERDGMGWDGMGWDGMGWDGMGSQRGVAPGGVGEGSLTCIVRCTCTNDGHIMLAAVFSNASADLALLGSGQMLL